MSIKKPAEGDRIEYELRHGTVTAVVTKVVGTSGGVTFGAIDYAVLFDGDDEPVSLDDSEIVNAEVLS